MQAVCTDPIPPPSAFAADYPPALEAVVMKALQRDPNDRYQSALELRRDLLAVARQFEGIPEELIKVVMQSVFEDRIELKRSILSDQHEAWSRDRMDSVVEVPMVPGHLTMTPSLEVPEEPSDPSADALAYSGVPTDGRGRSRSHSKLWLMLAGVVASGLATVLLGVMDNGSSPPPLANRKFQSHVDFETDKLPVLRRCKQRTIQPRR